MKKKSSTPAPTSNLPVSKQTAGGVSGAIIGGVIGGPVGALAGAIAGTMMGNRAAQGKTLISSSSVKTAKDAVKKVHQLKSLRTAAKPTATPAKHGKSSSRKKPAAKKAAKKPVTKATVKPKSAPKRK